MRRPTVLDTPYEVCSYSLDPKFTSRKGQSGISNVFKQDVALRDGLIRAPVQHGWRKLCGTNLVQSVANK